MISIDVTALPTHLDFVDIGGIFSHRRPQIAHR
jgi:hypothetical protein